jgi:hypothetical protein
MDTAVGIVKAYLELCGYFVLSELPVRVASGRGYRDATDLDVIAVRFPHAPLDLPRAQARPLDVFLGADPALDSLTTGVDVLVGEVKEGRARLNPALRRADTVAFALRRLGCCPEAEVAVAARAIAHMGEQTLTMPGGLPCRVRVMVFGGTRDVGERRAVTLGHCAHFIAGRPREARDVLAGAQFKDPVLGLLALQDKLARGDERPGTPDE